MNCNSYKVDRVIRETINLDNGEVVNTIRRQLTCPVGVN